MGLSHFDWTKAPLEFVEIGTWNYVYLTTYLNNTKNYVQTHQCVPTKVQGSLQGTHEPYDQMCVCVCVLHFAPKH